MTEKILSKCSLGIACSYGAEEDPEVCQRLMDIMAERHPDLVSDVFNCPSDAMMTHMILDPAPLRRIIQSPSGGEEQ